MGTDFVPISSNRTLSLPLEQYEVCECLSVIQDDVTEGDEVFYLTLTSSHPQVRTTGAMVHIIDDDGKQDWTCSRGFVDCITKVIRYTFSTFTTTRPKRAWHSV